MAGAQKRSKGEADSGVTRQPAARWPHGEQPWELSGCFLAHFAGKDSRETDRPELAQSDSSLSQSGVNSGTSSDMG